MKEKYLKNDGFFDRLAIGYAYCQNGRLIFLSKSYRESRKIVKTLADMLGRDMYLYSVNNLYEIYFVRKIKCMQNLKGGKK